MKDLSNENIVHIKTENTEYLQFRKLLEYKDIITHAYGIGIDKNYRTSRPNGNITKQELEKAKKDYEQLCKELNTKSNNIVKTLQAHTDNIIRVDKIEKLDLQVDGLCTNKSDIILATTNADCILLIFFDPIKKVIANTHSGWKGTLQRISVKTAQKMQKEYGCDPKNIICCMCPSIRKCHFEVDRDVKELFEKEFEDLPKDEIIEEKIPNEKWNIDTILINKIILRRLGLKDENIIDSGICSVCNKDLIHSFRVEKEGYGLNTAIVSLK